VTQWKKKVVGASELRNLHSSVGHQAK